MDKCFVCDQKFENKDNFIFEGQIIHKPCLICFSCNKINQTYSYISSHIYCKNCIPPKIKLKLVNLPKQNQRPGAVVNPRQIVQSSQSVTSDMIIIAQLMACSPEKKLQ